MGAIDGVEFLAAARFAIEELKNGDAVNVLLKIGVDARDGDADAAVAVLHHAPKSGGDENDYGSHQQQQPSHSGVHAKHHDDDEAQRENVAEDGHQARGPEFVQSVHVGGDARDQAADGIAIVKRNVEALEVLHQLPAQVEHGELAGTLHQVGFGEFAQESDHDGREIQG